jgi:hypothetical protein
LTCRPHAKIEDAWVYQAIRGSRSDAEGFGIVPWELLPGVEPVASDCLSRRRDIVAGIGITVNGRWVTWELPCPVPGTPKPLDDAQMAKYLRLVADDPTGEEQKTAGEHSDWAYSAWLDAQFRQVPMPSEQKPDIDGFHEGDRVRLIKPFNGERVRLEPGRTGTFVITDTAPAQIRLGRQEGLYTVLIDGPDWRLIGVGRGDIKKIPGRMRVSYYDDTIQVFE